MNRKKKHETITLHKNNHKMAARACHSYYYVDVLSDIPQEAPSFI